MAGLVAVAANLVAPACGSAWLAEGHRRIAVAAVESLPEEIPEVFRSAAPTIGDLALDPDAWRSAATPFLRDIETPQHYLDWERLGGLPLPRLRSEALREIAARNLGVADVGLLPWVIVEESDRLTIAFAELRRWPGDRAARAQALVAAGRLAHYGADLVQPLHTTIHHDGWALPDGSSPFVGTHARIDGLFQGAGRDVGDGAGGAEAGVFDDPFAAVAAELAASHALVDRVYEIDRRLVEGDGVADPQVVAFACERYRAGVRLVAGLMRTAWEASAEIELPEWLER